MIALIVIGLALAIAYAGTRHASTKAPAKYLRRSLRLYVGIVFVFAFALTCSELPRFVARLGAYDSDQPGIGWLWAAAGFIALGGVLFGFFAFRIFKTELSDYRRRHEPPTK